MGLLDKLQKAGSTEHSSALSSSTFFGNKEFIPTDLPILNVAFSGSLEGGLVPGLTVVAGLSKTFKTMLSLYCMKAYLDKYPDAVAILYDSEFGVTPDYVKGFNIDISRVLHVPITNIEELKFDIVKKLEAVEKNEKVFIMIDSVGNLASKKEVEDAENEKSVADMTRAKSLKSLFRIITPFLTTKKIPCLAINHIYMTQELYSKAIVGGGTGVMYSANTVFIISKAQEKDDEGIAGWKFTINIEKSRFVKEKSKLPFTVLYNGGIQKWSSLFELALESGHIVKVTAQSYAPVDMETGEIGEKVKTKTMQNDDAFFEKLINDEKFKQFVSDKFKLSGALSEDKVSYEDDSEED